MNKPTYEELEAQVKQLAAERDAVVAENAALKDINAWSKTDAFKNMYREFKTAESLGCQGVDCMHDAMLVAIMHAPQTPATDAILASLRAEGVEMFANHQQMEYDNLVSSGKILNDTGFSHYLSGEASTFAAQLRSKSEVQS